MTDIMALRRYPSMIRCLANGCTAETDNPLPDGWAWIGFDEESDGLPEGLYCSHHSKAFDALLMAGLEFGDDYAEGSA